MMERIDLQKTGLKELKLKYGSKRVPLNIDPERVAGVIKVNERRGLEDPAGEIEQGLKKPLGTPPLAEMVRASSPEKVVIIVNDVSRPTPYKLLLPPLLKELHRVGLKKEQISFIIATGVHEPHSREQSREIFGDDIVGEYRFVFHDPDGEMVDYGPLTSGIRLYLNKEVAEADFIITTGVILPHYFAGFSGGRKSILPGVAGRDTINSNHARMVDIMGNLPAIKENPVSLEMIEAARKIGVNFILNVVTNSKREIVKVAAGDLEEAWSAGVELSAEMFQVPLEERVEVAVVSPGGYPRDINFYQAQKALDHADHGTKTGGTIIMLAECPEGLGDAVFEDWLREAQKPEDNIERIKNRFVLGGHKAFAVSKVALDKEIILVSGLSKEDTGLLYARKMAGLDEALAYVEEKYRGDYKAVIMPQGSLTVPVVK